MDNLNDKLSQMRGHVDTIKKADPAYYRDDHHENRLIALKWKDELYETEFLGVELATTRTGIVSITGLLKPIEIDGAIVSWAYLHNYDIFEGFQFGVGDKIQVYKANMIILQIAENLTRSNTYLLPVECPCCGGPLEIIRTPGDPAAFLI